MAKNGRPSKLTPELQKRLCELIAEGNYYRSACACVGVSYKVFREWMLRGARARTGPYRVFRDAILKAEAEAESHVVAQWKAHMPENWQACRDFLARRHPKRWGPKDDLKVSGNPSAPLALQFILEEKNVDDAEDETSKGTAADTAAPDTTTLPPEPDTV